MKPETSQNIQKVKLHILGKKQSAFIASMLYNLNIEPANVSKVELVATEEKSSIFLNEDWFNDFSTEEQASILVHEVLHYTLQHDLRMGRRDPEMYQKACDQVVNNLLLDMDYTLPDAEQSFTKTKYQNMAVEAVYKDIEEETQNKKDQNNKSSGSGNGSSFGNDLSPSPGSIVQQNKRNQQVLNADMANQAQGNKSVGSDGNVFEQLFKDIKESRLDWRTILHGFADEVTNSEMSYHQFNRRFIPMELYLPEMKGENKIGRIALAFDVSDSVSNEEAQAFLSEIKKIKSDINPETISVTTFNHKIVAQFEIKEDDDLNDVKMDISGGTNLLPVFDYYNKKENEPVFLIVFSDLEVYQYPKKTNYPVIWICVNNERAEVPFGKLVHITSEDLTE